MTRDNEIGEGERREAARRRGERAAIRGAIVVALVLIGGTWLTKHSGGNVGAAWNIAVALLYPAALIFAVWRSRRITDEVQARNGVRAMAAGAAFYALVYPSWFFLWKGGVTPEPSHELLYVAMTVVIALRYVQRKFL